MKKAFLSIIFFAAALLVGAQAQKIVIKVEHGHHLINALSKSGQHVIISLDMKEVQNGWAKKIRGWGGKAEESKGTYTIHGAIIPEISKSPVTIYTHVSSSNTGTKVWWGIDMGSAMITPQTHSGEYAKMEKILRDFAAAEYIDDINLQIAAAEKVVQNSVRAQEKTVQKGQQILGDIEGNKKQKAELEQKLEQNRLDAIQLQKDLEQNKLDQQNSAAEVVKMQKALEVVKAKLNSVQ